MEVPIPLRRLGALSVAVVVVGFAGEGALASHPATVVQQTTRCQWKDLGSIERAVTYATSAMDTDNNVMYVYGGYLDSGAGITNDVQTITFGATLTRGDTATARLSIAAAAERNGFAGVYRSKGTDSAIYWIAGRDATPKAFNTVQVFQIATQQWSTLATTGSFGDHTEHSAAYDSKHDVIWVVGGDSTPCRAVPCPAPTMPTSYLAFDAITGAATWHDGPTGGPRSKGAVMAYDSRKERLLFFGGTSDGARGLDQVWALDLSDEDVTKAKWAQLRPGGVGPAVIVGSGAYDPERNWLVIYGGVKTDYAVKAKETAESRTFALDLNVEPPVWRNLNTSVGERIQAVMEYSPKHKAMILTGGRIALPDPTPSSYKYRSIHALDCSQSVAPTPVPTAPSGGSGQGVECGNLRGKVPAGILDAAMANPGSVNGWDKPCFPSQPASPFNTARRQLGLHNEGMPYHPLYNGLEWKCGCR